MTFPSLFFWLAGVTIVAFVDLIVIVNLYHSTKSPQTKLMWALAIIFLPVLGLIIWAYAGPRGMRKPPSSPEQSK